MCEHEQFSDMVHVIHRELTFSQQGDWSFTIVVLDYF